MNSDFEITIYNEFSLIKLLNLVKSNQELVLQEFKTADQAHTMIRTGKLFVCLQKCTRQLTAKVAEQISSITIVLKKVSLHGTVCLSKDTERSSFPLTLGKIFFSIFL